MHNSIIRQISKVSILKALTAKNIPYKIQGNAVIFQTNPFRHEKSCSLRGYIDSNLLHDFGTSATFNSFDVLTIDCDISQAIILGKTLLNGTNYISSTYIHNGHKQLQRPNFWLEFQQFEKINPNKLSHQKELTQILPLDKWLNPGLNKFFAKYCRFDTRNNTLVVGIFNQNTIVGYKWRRLKINGIIKKWVARSASIASTPMLNILPQDNCIFVCEGIHDFLSATIAGKSVLSIPSANYMQNLPDHICGQLKNMIIYLVPDNDLVGFKLMERLRNQLDLISTCVIDFILPPDVHDFSEFLALK